jgi:hypothetical protein
MNTYSKSSLYSLLGLSDWVFHVIHRFCWYVIRIKLVQSLFSTKHFISQFSILFLSSKYIKIWMCDSKYQQYQYDLIGPPTKISI